MKKKPAKILIFLAILAHLFVAAACSQLTPPSSEDELQENGDPNDYDLIDQLIQDNLFDELAVLVKARTYRNADLSEAEVVANLQEIVDFMTSQVEAFNEGQQTHKIVPFEWKQAVPGTDREYWMFGLRLGRGDQKLAVITHLDTVAPGDNPNWSPFELQRERRSYVGHSPQEFYVGRGSIDDKGPAIVAFNALKAIARRFDGSPKLDNVTLELLFDTSEETDLTFPHYLADQPDQLPDLGLVYDAFWCVRAEKGIEWPVFSIARGMPAKTGMWIESLDTPQGPVNQIPDIATAVIRSDSPEEIEQFAREVDRLYADYPFDDPLYRRANLTVDQSAMPNELILVTDVDGAQHGSAPAENRAEGANPLVSLANFLADLVNEGTLAPNEVGRMSQFIAWVWGTHVFGEQHPELMERHDEVFTQGNGTTYALTRFYTNPEDDPEAAASLAVDIRYAIGHHSKPWDGVADGFLPGELSIFPDQVFTPLVAEFNSNFDTKITFDSVTLIRPDVRSPEGENFSKVSSAFAAVMGEPCPQRAIGGGTDAKGQPQLIAAGPLFSEYMGPPVNYHGFNEAAPVEDLENGARIIYRLFADEIEGTPTTIIHVSAPTPSSPPIVK